MKVGMFSHMPKSSRENQNRKLIEFWVGSIRCGVDIMQVKEILKPGTISQGLGKMPFVVGVTKRGESVISVVDMGLRLNTQTKNTERSRKKWVVVKSLDQEMVLLVDKVVGVVSVSPDQERQQQQLVDESDSSCIARVFEDKEQLLFELDLESISKKESV